MAKDIFRILIASDTHLGCHSDDPDRVQDSFRTCREIFEIAKAHNVDFVLLGGDLFDTAVPSMATVRSMLEILRSNCSGDKCPQFTMIPTCSADSQPYWAEQGSSISLPVFSIHGNHDDPVLVGCGGDESVAACEMLASAGLMHYFGKQSQINSVTVRPILLQKGSSCLALYGLGHIRDKRLGDLFEANRVQFLRPSEVLPAGSPLPPDDEWFSVGVIHQNRGTRNGSRPGIDETQLPSCLDLVVWGHEHRSQIATERAGGAASYDIIQPGSTVATSCGAFEAAAKSLALLEVSGSRYRVKEVPLRTVRPFIHRDFDLSKDDSIVTRDALEAALGPLLETAAAEGRASNPHFDGRPIVRLRVKIPGGFATGKALNRSLAAAYKDIICNAGACVTVSRVRGDGGAAAVHTDGGGDDDAAIEWGTGQRLRGRRTLDEMISDAVRDCAPRMCVLQPHAVLQACIGYRHSRAAAAFDAALENHVKRAQDHCWRAFRASATRIHDEAMRRVDAVSGDAGGAVATVPSIEVAKAHDDALQGFIARYLARREWWAADAAAPPQHAPPGPQGASTDLPPPSHSTTPSPAAPSYAHTTAQQQHDAPRHPPPPLPAAAVVVKGERERAMSPSLTSVPAAGPAAAASLSYHRGQPPPFLSTNVSSGHHRQSHDAGPSHVPHGAASGALAAGTGAGAGLRPRTAVPAVAQQPPSGHAVATSKRSRKPMEPVTSPAPAKRFATPTRTGGAAALSFLN